MTALEAKLKFESELKDLYSKEETRSIFDYVLSELTGMAKVGILSQHSFQLDAKTEEEVYSILEKLKLHTPVQYIFGKAHFYGLELTVNSNVLIPRPETEELVDWIIKDTVTSHQLSADSYQPPAILDIGTGSGCIALALKKNLPECKVTALDISKEALETAKKNASALGIDVEFIQADALQLTHDIKPDRFSKPVRFAQSFDIIVANPPYIKRSDTKFVGKNVLDFEPHLALFVPDENPLVFFEAIASYAKKMPPQPPKGGKGVTVYFEIQENTGDALVALLNSMGFKDIIVRKDLSGKERMVKCRFFSELCTPYEQARS